MVIDPVSHSPPFLISSSAWGSASPMSLCIYMLQLSHKYGGVRGHKVEQMALHVPNNMDRAQTYLKMDCLKLEKVHRNSDTQVVMT